MPQGGQPVFLARRAYRRRRMMDAVRLLPVLGTVLLLLPGIWAPAESARPDTGRGAVYLFTVWAGLAAAAFALARGLGPALDEAERAEPAAPEPEDRDAL